MRGDSLLSLDNLSVTLGAARRVSQASFDLRAGEIASVVGANGAGKTTLLRAIAGDFTRGRELAGEVKFSGRELASMPPRQRALRMAVLAQQNTLSFPFLVSEVIALGRAPHDTGAVKDKAIVEQWAEAFDVQDLLGRVYTELSGGERQRVHLARVFTQLANMESAAPARLLLLDEPMSALDYKHQRQVAAAIAGIANNNVAVLQVMHDINLATQYSTRVIALRNGQVYSDSDVAEFMQAETLNAVFDINARLIQHPDSGRAMLA
ncbi:MAG: heme ABC transporter ATP-binding protein [Pseudomonadales bacterium]|nr:heme ABC transporter ATP-binding protein [Pseudomonadales bacterium]